MTPSHAKGTKGETAVVTWLRDERGRRGVERRARRGANDQGDIAGILEWVLEVKVRQQRYEIPDWMRETEVERVNAGATYGLLVVKPKGIGLPQVGKWWGIQPMDQVERLMVEAGY